MPSVTDAAEAAGEGVVAAEARDVAAETCATTGAVPRLAAISARIRAERLHGSTRATDRAINREIGPATDPISVPTTDRAINLGTVLEIGRATAPATSLATGQTTGPATGRPTMYAPTPDRTEAAPDQITIAGPITDRIGRFRPGPGIGRHLPDPAHGTLAPGADTARRPGGTDAPSSGDSPRLPRSRS